MPSESVAGSRPSVLLAYHFFHPDDVVSARLFSDLATELAHRGWRVTALTSERTWSGTPESLPRRERWGAVDIVRVPRPRWPQGKPVTRILNSAWMLSAWSLAARHLGPFDAVIIGSDPAFAVLFAPVARALWPSAVVSHWCYDLYPEAIAAEWPGAVARLGCHALRPALARAYGACDLLVDLGPCMGDRLAEYGSKARAATIVPWALVEPGAVPAVPWDFRRTLFGDAEVALLYSGTLGRAHEFEGFLALARACRARAGNRFSFGFACRGHRTEALRRALTPEDTNIRLLPFCAEEDLERQLASADVHLLSLRHEWSGLVVPSKFFGSLAAGRPVIYDGAPRSDIAQWVSSEGVGWCLAADGVEGTAESLLRAADARAFQRTGAAAHALYTARFSRNAGASRWHSLLLEEARGRARRPREAVAPPAPRAAAFPPAP